MGLQAVSSNRQPSRDVEAGHLSTAYKLNKIHTANPTFSKIHDRIDDTAIPLTSALACCCLTLATLSAGSLLTMISDATEQPEGQSNIGNLILHGATLLSTGVTGFWCGSIALGSCMRRYQG